MPIDKNFSTSISALSTGRAHAYVDFAYRMCKASSRPMFIRMREDRSMHRGHFSGPMPNSFAISPLFNWSIALRRVIDDGVRL